MLTSTLDGRTYMDLEPIDIAWVKEIIKKNEFFKGCTENEFMQLVEGMDKQYFSKGTNILFQGEISSKLGIVQEGKLSVTVTKKGGIKVKITDLEPGNYFGEISLLTPRAATASIKAEESSAVIFLPGEVVQNIAQKNKVLAISIQDKIEERLKSRDTAIDNSNNPPQDAKNK
jgi:CRP-like cAMP-binding protein